MAFDTLGVSMDQADKIRENRLRRMADRQGLALHKSRRRDPRALDYGEYWLMAGEDLVPQSRGRGLDHIEKQLDELPVVELRREGRTYLETGDTNWNRVGQLRRELGLSPEQVEVVSRIPAAHVAEMTGGDR